MQCCGNTSYAAGNGKETLRRNGGILRSQRNIVLEHLGSWEAGADQTTRNSSNQIGQTISILGGDQRLTKVCS